MGCMLVNLKAALFDGKLIFEVNIICSYRDELSAVSFSQYQSGCRLLDEGKNRKVE